jgi:hypothetical protein
MNHININKSTKTIILTITAVITLSVIALSMAANKKVPAVTPTPAAKPVATPTIKPVVSPSPVAKPSVAPAVQSVDSSEVTASSEPTPTATPKINVSRNMAIKIALNAYPGAKIIFAKLYNTVYIVRLATETEKHYLKIGALSGRILQDSLLNDLGKIEKTLDLPQPTPETAVTSPIDTPQETTPAVTNTPESDIVPTATPAPTATTTSETESVNSTPTPAKISKP